MKFSFSVVEDDLDNLSLDDSFPQKPSSKGGLHQPPPAFHCPSNSIGSGCLADFLRLDINSANKRLLRLEVCPYAHPNSTTEINSPTKSGIAVDSEMYYGLATAPPNSPVLTFGPFYNFTSVDFEINLQLGGPISHLGGGNGASLVRHGWVKGLLFEYICEFSLVMSLVGDFNFNKSLVAL